MTKELINAKCPMRKIGENREERIVKIFDDALFLPDCTASRQVRVYF